MGASRVEGPASEVSTRVSSLGTLPWRQSGDFRRKETVVPQGGACSYPASAEGQLCRRELSGHSAGTGRLRRALADPSPPDPGVKVGAKWGPQPAACCPPHPPVAGTEAFPLPLHLPG